MNFMYVSTVLCLLVLFSCSHDHHHKMHLEHVISAHELPAKVTAALPKDLPHHGVTYVRKKKKDEVSYEINYEDHGDQFAIRYNEEGKIVEKEKRVEFSKLPLELQRSVDKAISAEYPGYTIILTEEVYMNNETFLEVKFSHNKSKTGVVEAFFDYKTGILKEFLDIKMKSIPTLN
jgi:hypothetical protein